MNLWAVAFLSGVLMGMVDMGWAHVGDQVFPLFELTDEDLEIIDLKDGHVEDWEEVIGEPTLTPDHFTTEKNLVFSAGIEYDPADLDYRIWMGWHDPTDRIYVGAQFIDDVYINEYEPGTNYMGNHDCIQFLVDGDHGGEPYITGTAEEAEELGNPLPFQYTQAYDAIARTPDGHHVSNWDREMDWTASLPYADGGGMVYGEQPTISVIEFYITPFDHLIPNSPKDSQRSDLFRDKVIGFAFILPDVDSEPKKYESLHILSDPLWDMILFGGARFVDGVLVGSHEDTAIHDITWARIKASLSAKPLSRK